MSEVVEILSRQSIQKTLSRMAQEINRRTESHNHVVIIGIQRGGLLLSRRLAHELEKVWGHPVPLGALDVSMHRDDINRRFTADVHPTEIPCDLDEATVILVDDVLYSGRTVRAAMDALNAFGRPRRIQLAVLIDRGHREVPVKPDYIGKEITTTHNQRIDVRIGDQGDDERVVMEIP